VPARRCRGPRRGRPAGIGQRRGDGLEDGITATAWAADHAGELGADPRRLVVAGEALGAGVAAAVALHARDVGWPVLTRQLLIRPDLGAALAPGPGDPAPLALKERPLAGVAPATVLVTGDDSLRADDGRRYAALLRRAGVEVEELRDGGQWTERTLGDLARSLGRSVDAPPTERASHGEVPA
jgi:acetyl esterase/lipase